MAVSGTDVSSDKHTWTKTQDLLLQEMKYVTLYRPKDQDSVRGIKEKYSSPPPSKTCWSTPFTVKPIESKMAKVQDRSRLSVDKAKVKEKVEKYSKRKSKDSSSETLCCDVQRAGHSLTEKKRAISYHSTHMHPEQSSVHISSVQHVRQRDLPDKKYRLSAHKLTSTGKGSSVTAFVKDKQLKKLPAVPTLSDSNFDICANVAYELCSVKRTGGKSEEMAKKKATSFVQFKTKEELRQQYRHRPVPPPKILNSKSPSCQTEMACINRKSFDWSPSDKQHTQSIALSAQKTDIQPVLRVPSVVHSKRDNPSHKGSQEYKSPLKELEVRESKEDPHTSPHRFMVKQTRDLAFEGSRSDCEKERPNNDYTLPFSNQSDCSSTLPTDSAKLSASGDYMPLIPKRKKKQVISEYETIYF